MSFDAEIEARRCANDFAEHECGWLVGGTCQDCQRNYKRLMEFSERVREEALAEKPQRLDSEIVCPECDALLNVTLMVATTDGDVGGSYDVSEPGKTAERVAQAREEGHIAGLEEAAAISRKEKEDHPVHSIAADVAHIILLTIRSRIEGLKTEAREMSERPIRRSVEKGE